MDFDYCLGFSSPTKKLSFAFSAFKTGYRELHHLNSEWITNSTTASYRNQSGSCFYPHCVCVCVRAHARVNDTGSVVVYNISITAVLLLITAEQLLNSDGHKSITEPNSLLNQVLQAQRRSLFQYTHSRRRHVAMTAAPKLCETTDTRHTNCFGLRPLPGLLVTTNFESAIKYVGLFKNMYVIKMKPDHGTTG